MPSLNYAEILREELAPRVKGLLQPRPGRSRNLAQENLAEKLKDPNSLESKLYAALLAMVATQTEAEKRIAETMAFIQQQEDTAEKSSHHRRHSTAAFAAAALDVDEVSEQQAAISPLAKAQIYLKGLEASLQTLTEQHEIQLKRIASAFTDEIQASLDKSGLQLGKPQIQDMQKLVLERRRNQATVINQQLQEIGIVIPIAPPLPSAPTPAPTAPSISGMNPATIQARLNANYELETKLMALAPLREANQLPGSYRPSAELAKQMDQIHNISIRYADTVIAAEEGFKEAQNSVYKSISGLTSLMKQLMAAPTPEPTPTQSVSQSAATEEDVEKATSKSGPKLGFGN